MWHIEAETSIAHCSFMGWLLWNDLLSNLIYQDSLFRHIDRDKCLPQHGDLEVQVTEAMMRMFAAHYRIIKDSRLFAENNEW
jgi:hypothetical protein